MPAALVIKHQQEVLQRLLPHLMVLPYTFKNPSNFFGFYL